MIWVIVASLHVMSSGKVASVNYYETQSLADCQRQISETGPITPYTLQDGTAVEIVAECLPFDPEEAAKLPPSVFYFNP